MEAKFNLNYPVKVRLTEEGVRFCERDHMETRSNLLNGSDYKLDIGDFGIKVDEEGYTEIAGWKFMQLFGSEMRMGSTPLFDLNVIVTNCEEVK